MAALDIGFPKILEAVEQYKKVKSIEIQHIKDESKVSELRQRADLDKYNDVIKEYCRVEQTHVGNILDA